jgi:hypothetical protein
MMKMFKDIAMVFIEEAIAIFFHIHICILSEKKEFRQMPWRRNAKFITII